MNFRAIFYVIGILLSILGASMGIPALVDITHNNPEWKGFVFCMVFTLFSGGMLTFTAYRKDVFHLTIREGFLLTAITWATLSIFSAFPFWISGNGMSVVDSIFEAVSGVTTTGSTVMTDLDHTAPGLLMWRALLQWLGGIGIIVTALSIFPFLKLGGMQLFKTESSEKEKALPRAAELAASITVIYTGLTFLCFVAYRLTGMTNFDAVAHAMTTIATGGFSTRDASFGAFEGTYADMVAATFIVISCLPFVLYLKFARGNRTSLFQDSQVRVFLWIIFIAVMLLTFYKVAYLDLSFLHSLRLAYFHVVVIISGTGYGLHDFEEWGSFPVLLMFCLMFIGGCAGSTTCSIKVFR
ncbi:MAG: TrkH family potassium uptake protein, partial [Pseudobdellovibrionaceae bacterium]